MSWLIWAKLGGAALLLTVTALLADANGANRIIAREAKSLQRANAAMVAAGRRLASVQDKLVAADADRRDIVREIYRAVPTIVDRPVYRSICADDDGVRLLDRARAAANGGGSQPTSPAAVGTADTPQH